MRTEVECELLFQKETCKRECLGHGWSTSERNFTWTSGDRSEVVLPVPAGATLFYLEIWLSPFTRPPVLKAQRLIVKINGTAVGRSVVEGRTVLGYCFPRPVVGQYLNIEFHHPDCKRPGDILESSDRRLLAFAFDRLRLFRVLHAPPPLVQPPADDSRTSMMLRFESLGDNGEFGVVQRRAGAEPLGLLRFSRQPIDLLVRAVDERFARLLDPDESRVVTSTDGREYEIYVASYRMTYPTQITTTEMDIATVRKAQTEPTRSKVRLFLEAVTGGEKIFVFKRNKPLALHEALPLFAALNRIGPAVLLIVCHSDGAHPARSIDVIMPGLFFGYLTEFGNMTDAQPVATDDWYALCHEALSLAVAEPAFRPALPLPEDASAAAPPLAAILRRAARVYLHGNCQARGLSTLFSELFPNWRVDYYEVFGPTILPEIDRYRRLVTQADVVIAQPVRANYRERTDLSLAWIKESVRAGADVIVFPSMYFEGQLIGSHGLDIQAYGTEWHDALLTHLVAAGLDEAQVAAILSDEDLYDARFIASEIALSIETLRRREADDKIDVPLPPFLEQFATETVVSNTVNHPRRGAFLDIGSQILRKLALDVRIPAAGQEYLPFPRIPCLPAVARFLGSATRKHPEWAVQDEDHYLLAEGLLTRAQYWNKQVALLKSHSGDALLAMLRRSKANGFMTRLARARPDLPAMEIWRQ